MKKIFTVLLITFSVLFAVGGSGCLVAPQPPMAYIPAPTPASPPNQLPVIGSISIRDQQIWQGQTTTIRVSAYDHDGDVLQYSWSSTGGTLSGYNIPEPTFAAPSYVEADTDVVCTLIVYDGKGGSAQKSIVIRVQHRDRECCTSITIFSPVSSTFVCQGSPITVYGRVGSYYCDCGCGTSRSQYANTRVDVKFDGSIIGWKMTDQDGFYWVTFIPPCDKSYFIYPHGRHLVEVKARIDCCREATAKTFISLGTCCRSCGH